MFSRIQRIQKIQNFLKGKTNLNYEVNVRQFSRKLDVRCPAEPFPSYSFLNVSNVTNWG